MDPNYEGKNLEKRVKQVAIASAYTLTPPTAYEPDEPPSKEGASSACYQLNLLTVVVPFYCLLTKSCVLFLTVVSVEDKVLRVEQEGDVFKYKDT